MGKSAILAVKIIGDSVSAVSSMTKAQRASQSFKDKLNKASIGAAAALGAITAGAKECADAAGNLQQSVGGVETVFGSSSDKMLKWSQNASQAVGLSQNSYNELATLMGSQLQNFGMSVDESATKTNDLIGLGADLSSMFGGTTSEAVEALSSALKGEMDPIEKYGISLNDATLKGYAAKLGLESQYAAGDKNAKMQATLAAVTEQSGKATGNFAKEADTAQGQQQRMNASMEDAKAKLGTALLPILTVAAQKLAGLAQWIQQNSSWLVPLIAAIAAVAAVILVMNGVLTAYNVIAGIGAVATGALVGPILLVIAAIAAIIAIIVLLVRNWDNVKQAGATAAGWIKDKWNGLMGWIRGIPGMISGYFNNATDLLRNAGLSIINGFFNGLKSAWNKVTGWISGIGDWIRDHKGPESYDAQLLVNNGYVTMQGFGKGLSQGYESAVVPQVTSVAGKISSLIGQQRFDVPTITADASLSGTDSLARIAASARKQADTIIIVEKLDVTSSGNLDNDETASKIVDSLNGWARVRGKKQIA